MKTNRVALVTGATSGIGEATAYRLQARNYIVFAAGRNPHALDALRGRRILATAGIGDPERFFSMLEARGLTIERLPLADHASFDPLPWDASTPEVIVTEKDAVKLAALAPSTTRVWVVTLDFGLPPALAQALRAALDDVIARRVARA